MIDEKKLIEQLKRYKSEWKLAEPFHEGIASGLKIAIEVTEKQRKVNGWIPYSERLPEEDGEYLCYEKLGNLCMQKVRSFAKNLYKVDKYDFSKKEGGGFYDFDGEYGHYIVGSVIAWQPLPEPYKEEV